MAAIFAGSRAMPSATWAATRVAACARHEN
jgi:hypothetical protein